MSEALGILLFAAVLITVVLIHEAGHFFTAKAFGIKVEEFFVGFGPRLWSTRRGETEYGVKLIPAGGYVRIAGMNPFEELPPEQLPRTFGAKPAWQRAVVIATGPLTHFVVALLALFVFFVAVGATVETSPVVASVQPRLSGHASPAASVGLRRGDRIVALDGRLVTSTQQLLGFTRSHIGEEVSVTVVRGGRRLTVRAVPERSVVGGRVIGRLGITVASLGQRHERLGPIRAGQQAFVQTGSTIKGVLLSLGRVFGASGFARIGQLLMGNAQRTANDATSIVGASRLAGEAAQAGAWEFVFWIVVLFNVFVGILNLVPLPPLDGGHLAVIAYEKLRRRRPDVRKLVPVTALVTGLIVLLAISLAYIDITNPLPNPFR